MKVIIPERVDTLNLVASNIPENDHPEWSATTTYARGAFVMSLVTKTIYRSLTDANIGNDPDLEQAALADPLVDDPDPINWQVIGATNRWRMFDRKPSRRSVMPDKIDVSLQFGVFVGGIAGFNVRASYVEIEVEVDGEMAYEREIVMQDDSVVGDWYAYFFAPLSPLTEFVLTDVPPYADAIIHVRIFGASAEIGDLVIGEVRTLGEALFGPTDFNGLDFSYVQQDEFGDLTTVVREATRVSRFEVLVPSATLLGFDNLMRSLRGGQPAVWIGLEDPRRAAVNYGFYRDYRAIYNTVDVSLVSIQVQGIV
jgi:hypothetical protein